MHKSLLLFVSVAMAAMIVLSAPIVMIGYNFAAKAQEAPDDTSVNDSNLKIDKIVDGLDHPTTMAFLDEHTMIVLEKDSGEVRMIKDGELQSEPLLKVSVANDNERGLLGIAISKENATTTYVFIYFTESDERGDNSDINGMQPAEGNRLYRYELQGNHLVNPKLLLDLPAEPGDLTQVTLARYVGGPVAIGPDGYVYVVIGDVDHHKGKVQNVKDGSAADGTGGVLRIGKNGELPPSVIGNGTFGKYYYAYGIRNSFGLTFDPVTGNLWDTENGPDHGDEINLIDRGFNSGWRVVAGVASPEEVNDLVLFNGKSHYSDPEFSWTTTIGPTAIEFYNSSKLGKQYQNDMFVGDVNNGAIYHFKLDENRTSLLLSGDLADKVANTSEENAGITFGTGFGPITDIKTGPDGGLYVVAYGRGTIYKISGPERNDNNNDDNNNNIPSRTDRTATAASTGLTIQSADLSGNIISGIYAAVWASNGTILEKGFTPLKFSGTEGSTYTVTISNQQERTFNHWNDGASHRVRMVTLGGDTTIVAYFQ
jgi:aldose sugar dehydrogenase